MNIQSNNSPLAGSSRQAPETRGAKAQRAVDKLPDELIVKILDELPNPTDRIRVSVLSSDFKRIAYGQDYWSALNEPVKNVSYEQLARVTKQERKITAPTRLERHRSDSTPWIAGFAPPVLFVLGYTIGIPFKYAGCKPRYCADYVGPTATFDPKTGAMWHPNGTDPRVYAECLAHFGDPFYTNLSGPYGANFECDLTGPIMGGVFGFIAVCAVGALVGLIVRYYAQRQAQPTRRDVEMGPRERGPEAAEDDAAEQVGTELQPMSAPDPTSPAEIIRKTAKFEELKNLFFQAVEKGEHDLSTRFQNLALPRATRGVLGRAVLFRALEGHHTALVEKICRCDIEPNLAHLLRAATRHNAADKRDAGALSALITRAAAVERRALEERRENEAQCDEQVFVTERVPAHIVFGAVQDHLANVARGRRQQRLPELDVACLLLSNMSPARRRAVINSPTGHSQRTLMHLATLADSPAFFRYLLRQGGDVWVQDPNGVSTFGLIAYKESLREVYGDFRTRVEPHAKPWPYEPEGEGAPIRPPPATRAPAAAVAAPAAAADGENAAVAANA